MKSFNIAGKMWYKSNFEDQNDKIQHVQHSGVNYIRNGFQNFEIQLWESWITNNLQTKINILNFIFCSPNGLEVGVLCYSLLKFRITLGFVKIIFVYYISFYYFTLHFIILQVM